jgi:thiol-disulfide isomerase/thioredoxin
MSKGIWVLVVMTMAGCAQPPVPPSSDDPWLNGWKQQPNSSPFESAPEPPKETPKLIPTLPPVEMPVIPQRRGGEPAPAPPAEEPDREQFPNAPEWKPGRAFPKGTILAEASADIPADWTGAVVYHASWCKNCPKLIDDLKASADAGWVTGVDNNVHFKLVDFDKRKTNVPKIEKLPTIVYFINGKEDSRVVGYGGSEHELNAILAKHPRVKRDARGGFKNSQSSPLWYDAPQQQVTVYDAAPVYSVPVVPAPNYGGYVNVLGLGANWWGW